MTTDETPHTRSTPATMRQPPPNHMNWAVLTMAFLCTPLGGIAVFFASRVNKRWLAGDEAGALRASMWAKGFATAGTVFGVSLVLFVLAASSGGPS
ncbi:MAG: CD225/dispanin family protein [Acidimicrobiales bacterium]